MEDILNLSRGINFVVCVIKFEYVFFKTELRDFTFIKEFVFCNDLKPLVIEIIILSRNTKQNDVFF